MATTKPFCRIVNSQLAEQPLNVLFSHGAGGSCKLVISTGYKIIPGNLKNGRVSGVDSKAINDLLNAIQSDLEQAYQHLKQRGETITKDQMKVAYEAQKTLRKDQEQGKKFQEQFDYLQVANEVAVPLDSEDEISAELAELERQLAAKRAELANQQSKRTKALGKLEKAKIPTSMVSKKEEVETLFRIPDARKRLDDDNKADLFTTYINSRLSVSQNKIGASTVRTYISLINLLNRFNPRLKIQEMNRNTLYQIEHFMIGENILNQSIEYYMSKIEATLNFYEFDLNLSLSYKRYKFELTVAKHDVVFLKPNQLRDFINYDKPLSYSGKQNRKTNKYYDRIKDIFLMLLSTGLRISDIFVDFKPLIKTEVSANGKPTEYIHLIPVKTIKKQIRVKIPVTKTMNEILIKYDYKIPKIEDYYFNQLIKEICADIPSFQEDVTEYEFSGQKKIINHKKFWENISSHVGRKTNISYLFAMGLSVPEIIGRSGHTEVNTLMIYAQKMENIGNEVKKLNFFA